MREAPEAQTERVQHDGALQGDNHFSYPHAILIHPKGYTEIESGASHMQEEA